jgi:hypothetical protein
MKKSLLLRFAALVVFCYFIAADISAQKVNLELSAGRQALEQAGSFSALKNIREKASFKGRYYYVAQFATIPANGSSIQLHARLADKTWLVSSANAPEAGFAKALSITQTAVIAPELKVSSLLANGRSIHLPQSGGRFSLMLSFFPGISPADVKASLLQQGVVIEDSRLEKNNLLAISATLKQIEKLAALPFVAYIQPQAHDKILNEKTRFMSGAFGLNASVANGGYGLLGKGVVVGVGDDADPSFHPDLQDKIINRTPGIVNDHGAHVTGTIAGGGVLQPDRRGFAPMATIISQYFSGIWLNAEQYVKDFGMVLTNNSYGAQEGDCSYYGVYDLYSQVLDDEAASYPSLLHVFAAGNSGDDVCSPLPAHYGTILGSYQSAKNVITVGRTDYPQVASSSSSSGPVKDGRLKPEIMALGIVESCNGTDSYWGAYGTSMSAPGITGSLALLYERYRQLHSGSNPDGALMKPVLLNGARDLGIAGPDYRHGFGFVNLANSIRILNNSQFFSGSLAQNGSKDSVITVSGGNALLKVMLYWHDLPASPLAFKTLVNDLDLEVVQPNGTVVHPKILDPAHPTAAATEGADHVNNVEQVIIKTPVAGNYIIRVKGFDIGGSPSQKFYATFDAVPAELVLRTPVKGDNWSVSSPDEFGVVGVAVSWDDEGTGAGTYKLEYSLDSGSTWATITDNLRDTCRYYGWRPPANTATTGARVRISKNGKPFTSTSNIFSILNRPAYTVTNSCDGYLTVTWTAVEGADDYEVIMKKGPQMVSVAVVTPPNLKYVISGLNRDSIYYVAVRARKGGIAGRWVQSFANQANAGSCAGNISDGDLRLDSITAPVYGRDFTSITLGNNETVKVRIKNLDNTGIDAGTYNIKLSVDGGAFISQAGASAIAAQGLYTHSFTGVNLSAKINHTLVAVVQNTGATDNVSANDTFRINVKNIANDPVTLAVPFVQDFETAPVFSLAKTTYGLSGIEHWDYFNSDKFARARSFVNTGIARSGDKAITLDVSKSTPYIKNAANNLQGTFNLSNYSAADDIRLEFYFKQHGSAQVANAQNRVWVRGADTQKWIEAYNLSANQTEEPGIWKYSGSIELNDLLSNSIPAQQLSSSFQVRFGQYAEYGMGDNTTAAGYSFDDVKLYIATNDLQLVSIDTPATYSCGLSNAVPVKITVRNSTSHAVSNIPVSYRINGGALVNEIISASVPANGSIKYTFSSLANFSAGEVFNLEAFVHFTGDNVPQNDTSTVVVRNLPVISSFPYLEDFENGNGHFFTTGINSSWEWGKPISIKIDTAASGTKVWKTRLAGNYNDREYSQLNSPCYDISTLQNPTLSFSFAYSIEDCTPYGILCDQAWVEYSTDGINWLKLGATAQGTNWYDIINTNVWVRNNRTYWHNASISLPKGLPNVRLRFVFTSDEATNYEGVAIDDIHIYDLPAPLYSSPGSSNAITQNVSGSAPVNFTTNGKLIATILPNGNNLGSTEVKAYIYNGAVRNTGTQYYGNRNITIKPANKISGSATVRFYFTDKEANDLRLAASCPACSNPKDYTHIGVTQYTDADRSKEDSLLVNNNNGITRFIHGSDLRLVPFDSGYYAEFAVNSFSEFWLNDGRGIDIPLPGRWISVDALKQPNSVVKVTWGVVNETDISKYEVQVSTLNNGTNNFVSVGETAAKNASEANYEFLDQRPSKGGDYYYRIKQVDKNGNAFYSPIVHVHFSYNDFDVQLYPNPVKDNLLLNIESSGNSTMQMVIYNMAGQQLYTRSFTGINGTTQQQIATNKLGLAAGVYTIAVTDGKSWWYGKVVKE